MKTLVRLVSLLIPFKGLRKRFRYWGVNTWYCRQVKRKARSFGADNEIAGRFVATKTTSIGNDCSLRGGAVYGSGDFIVKDHVVIGPGLIVQTQNHNYEGELLPFDGEYTLKPVVVDEAVWMGMNVTLLPGTHIGEGAIIQAGSVVHGEIPPLAIAGGNPAKVFAWRNQEHYRQLKAAGKYIKHDL